MLHDHTVLDDATLPQPGSTMWYPFIQWNGIPWVPREYTLHVLHVSVACLQAACDRLRVIDVLHAELPLVLVAKQL